MSLLPRYHPVPTGADDEAPPPWTDSDSKVHGKPLGLDPIGTVANSCRTGPVHIVAFTFEPRFPMLGETTHVVGIIGIDKEDTLTTIQNIFPILLEIPRNRLELSIAIESTIDGSHWSIIRDEAWPGFAHNPPPRMLVRVIDALGDLEAREEYEKRQRIREIVKELSKFGLVCSIVVVPFAIVILFLWIFGIFAPPRLR